MGPVEAGALLDGPLLREVERLDLSSCPLSREVIDLLAGADALSALRALFLFDVELTATGVLALLGSTALAFEWEAFDDAEVAAILAAPGASAACLARLEQRYDAWLAGEMYEF